MGGWAEAKERAKVLKAQIAAEKKDGELQSTIDEIRDADLDRIINRINTRMPNGANSKAFEAVVMGEMYSTIPEARDVGNSLTKLDDETLAVKTIMSIEEPEVIEAAKRHVEAVTAPEAVAGWDSVKHVAHQALLPLLALLAGVVALETLFQVGPFKDLFQRMSSGMSETTLDIVSAAVAAVFVGIGVGTVFWASKLWGEFTVRTSRASDTKRDVTGEIVGEYVSPKAAIGMTIAAAAVQVVLFKLRFSGNETASTTNTTLVLVSGLLMMASIAIAVLEYRRAVEMESLTPVPMTEAKKKITEYLEMHRFIFGTVPIRRAEIERKNLEAVASYLRKIQSSGDQLGPEVRDALGQLLNENQAKLDSQKPIEYIPPKLGGPNGISGLGDFAA